MKTQSIVLFPLSILFTLLISGCTTLPNFSPSSLWNDEADEEKTIVYGESTKLDAVQMGRQNDELIKRLDDAEEELASLRNDVTKVIALESDLAFIVDQFTELNTETYSLPAAQSNISELSNFATASELAKFEANQNSFINGDNKKAAVTSSAATLNSSLLEPDSDTLKFSGVSFDNNDKAQNTNYDPESLQNNTLANKFSNTSNLETTGINNNCQTIANVQANKNKFAVHLASYSNSSNVAPGLNKLFQVHSAALCNKGAIVKDTVVNNKNYISLRFGPFNSELLANDACKLIQAKNQYCKVTRFDGSKVEGN